MPSDDRQAGRTDERRTGSHSRIEDAESNGMGGRMNNIWAFAEKIALKEIVCMRNLSGNTCHAFSLLFVKNQWSN